ncbi:MAG: DNA-deoxyinosine glycosylase [Clostridia bacterium]|nr:DNA-deoxyinosine glycosylase [Clostridia bacterium]
MDKTPAKKHIVHPIPPFYGRDSQILILGSFPSVKSREQLFFYGHPGNRFWKVLARVFGDAEPKDVPQKRAFLKKHRVALWDVVGECDIEGSQDSSISGVTPNDLTVLLAGTQITRVFVNGRTALKYYQKYSEKRTGMPAVCLPSTSPANAAWSLEALASAWREAILGAGGSDTGGSYG